MTVEWDILNKIKIVTENAANMLAAVPITGWNSIGCYAHHINLIVQNAMGPIQETIGKVNRTVSHFKKM